LREFKSLTLRTFINEIKTKALLDCRAFFVKYGIGQGLTGLVKKEQEKTKKLLNYCTLFSDDPQISSVKGIVENGNDTFAVIWLLIKIK